MIFKAGNGAEIIEIIDIGEEEALKKYPQINHALAIVKVGSDYLLGWHNWRGDWETFGGCLENGEELRECIIRECEEELGIKDCDADYLGVVHYYMPPCYFNPEWHEEYGGLYGIKLSAEVIPIIEKKRKDKDEIGAISLYSRIIDKDRIDEINERLLSFY